MANLTGVSRFKRSKLIQTRSGKATYGVIDYKSIKNIDEENYTLFRVETGFEGRSDLIAARQYGDPHLEWVIILANAVKNPLNWPRPGDVIKLPKLSYIRRVI